MFATQLLSLQNTSLWNWISFFCDSISQYLSSNKFNNKSKKLFTADTVQVCQYLVHTFKWVAQEWSRYFLTGWETTNRDCLPHKLQPTQGGSQWSLNIPRHFQRPCDVSPSLLSGGTPPTSCLLGGAFPLPFPFLFTNKNSLQWFPTFLFLY